LNNASPAWTTSLLPTLLPAMANFNRITRTVLAVLPLLALQPVSSNAIAATASSFFFMPGS